MMWKKIAVIAGLSVAALGVGGAAWAESASSAPAAAPAVVAAASSSSTPTTAAKSAHHKKGKGDKAEKFGKKVAHAQWVSKDGKTGAWVTHDAVRGTVTAVSSTSITVKAADSTSETFAVNSSTKVHAKGDTKAHPGTIAQVKPGDEVAVLGTGASTFTATHVIDRGAPKK